MTHAQSGIDQFILLSGKRDSEVIEREARTKHEQMGTITKQHTTCTLSPIDVDDLTTG